MAQRKRKDLGPHLDGNPSAADRRTRPLELPPGQFDNVVRAIKNGSRDAVLQIRQATFDNLARLGVKRNKEAAVAGTPAGSDNVDVQSVIAWMRKIPSKDYKRAVRQLVALDATAVART